MSQMGVPYHLDLGRGVPTPHSPVNQMGYPNPRNVNRQTFPNINITFPRTLRINSLNLKLGLMNLRLKLHFNLDSMTLIHKPIYDQNVSEY